MLSQNNFKNISKQSFKEWESLRVLLSTAIECNIFRNERISLKAIDREQCSRSKNWVHTQSHVKSVYTSDGYQFASQFSQIKVCRDRARVTRSYALIRFPCFAVLTVDVEELKNAINKNPVKSSSYIFSLVYY